MVTVKAEDENSAYRDAMAQAEHYCEQFKKAPVVLEENAKYSGDMSEENYKALKTASKAAKRVGGAVFMGGSQNAYNDSRKINTGAGVLDDVAGEGYTVRVKFSCQ